jgi:hypothetical protein
VPSAHAVFGSSTAPASERAGAEGRGRYWSWAALLRRAFELDVLRCPRCGCRRRLSAIVEDPGVIGKILAHLGLTPSPDSHGPGPPRRAPEASAFGDGPPARPADNTAASTLPRPRPARPDSAALLKRAFAVDVLHCPRRGGRRRIVAVHTRPETLRPLLERLGLGVPAAPPGGAITAGAGRLTESCHLGPRALIALRGPYALVCVPLSLRLRPGGPGAAWRAAPARGGRCSGETEVLGVSRHSGGPRPGAHGPWAAPADVL